MATPASKRPPARLSRDDWVRAALDSIAEKGLAGVAVEPLAVKLGVTKGSFYSHFASRDEVIEAALDRWQRTHGDTGLGLARYAAIDDPAQRLRELLLAAIEFSQSGRPSVHVSLLGELADPRVRKAVAYVDQSRLRFITGTYRQLGLPPARAADRARLVYATYLGLLQLSLEAPDQKLAKREIGRFMAELSAALIPQGQTPRR
jgi:AcrR family transcriptional regulator